MKCAWLALALAPACITPSVVDSSGRQVEVKAEQLAWRPATAADLSGLFESVAIEGEAAAALWRAYYHFAADGTYTGAALVIGGANPEFQTLSGSWRLEGGLLDLGDGIPILVSAAEQLLRMESEGGVATFRRAAVQ